MKQLQRHEEHKGNAKVKLRSLMLERVDVLYCSEASYHCTLLK